MMTAPEIEQTYQSLLRRDFPHQECRLLRKKQDFDIEAFTNDLRVYWTSIAGFASSATRLAYRAQLQLYWGKQALAHSFFERHPEYAALEKNITEKKTPKLREQINLYEEQRKSLLLLLKQLCWLRSDVQVAPASTGKVARTA